MLARLRSERSEWSKITCGILKNDSHQRQSKNNDLFSSVHASWIWFKSFANYTQIWRVSRSGPFGKIVRNLVHFLVLSGFQGFFCSFSKLCPGIFWPCLRFFGIFWDFFRNTVPESFYSFLAQFPNLIFFWSFWHFLIVCPFLKPSSGNPEFDPWSVTIPGFVMIRCDKM